MSIRVGLGKRRITLNSLPRAGKNVYIGGNQIARI